MTTKNRLAVVGLAAGLLGGGAAGIALTSPGLAVGQTADSNTNSNENDDAASDHADFLNDALAPLVENGTITQAQADAVIKALEDARPDVPFGRHMGPGPRFGIGPLGDVFRAAADEIGVSVTDLRSALADGQTIAEVAEAHNVAATDVVDAMVAEIKDKLDEAVANDRLSQAEADERLADAKEHMTGLVNGDLPRFEGRGPFGRDRDADDSGNSDSESGTDAQNTGAAV